MQVQQIRLRSYRNHVDNTVDFGPGVNIVCGPNGAGKTSLLEAVQLIATGSSFRVGDEAALAADGSEYGAVTGLVMRSGRRTELVVTVGTTTDRFRINSVPKRRTRDFAGHLHTVVFTPDDLDLVKGSPVGRRNHIDRAMVAKTPRIAAVVSEWERALRQRNSLLRAQLRTSAAEASLLTWTDVFVEKAVALACERMTYIMEASPFLTSAAAELGYGDVEISYTAGWTSVAALDVDQMRADLIRALKGTAGPERERGVTLVGPHRDDVTLSLNGRQARTRASQGEQRALALCLRLAEMRLLRDVLADEPVLLLDDVFSELDPTRRDALLASLPRAQTILTIATDDPHASADVRSAIGFFAEERELTLHVIHLQDGKVLEAEP